MTIKDCKCNCGHNDFFFADKGNQKGIYCSYCGKWLKWANKDERNLFKKQEPCEDCISRAYIEPIVEELENICVTCDEHILNLLADIKNAPPITPQQKKGLWIEIAQYSDGNHKIECSECGHHIFDRGHANSFNVKNKYKYCPNCGTKMEVE